ncbi:MAG: hypothetical protein L3J97_01055 [Thermoplasmata archaeon]|nr:hypothetical protein [Thermoplasmata archaeon]
MALPPAEIKGRPWYEERTGRWPNLNGSAQASIIIGTFFVALWIVWAIPPILSPSHVVAFCRPICYILAPQYFVAGEVTLAVVFLGGAAWSFMRARTEMRRWG